MVFDVGPSPGALPSVLHLLAPAEFGGLESVVLSLARGQRRMGQESVVGALVGESSGGHSFLEALDTAGVPVRTLQVPARGYIQERRVVGELIRDLRPDVLHTHGYRPDVVDSGVGRRLGLGTVTTVHGFTGFGFRGRIYESLQRRWFRRFSAVIAVSETLFRHLSESGVSPDRLHMVRNAWERPQGLLDRDSARRALGLDPGKHIVGWVGRVSPEKGPEVMIRALAGPQSTGFYLSMVGTGPMMDELRGLSQTLGVAERIRWHGAVKNAGKHLRAFDAVLLTSWTEGTPMVLLEAMAAGVPVITTSVGGIPDVVSRDQAVLVPAGDTEAVAQGIRAVLDSPELAAARVSAAQDRLSTDFSVEAWVRRHGEVYQRILS